MPTKTGKCQMHREQLEDVGENGDEIQGILQVPSVKNCRRHHAKKPKRLRGGIPIGPYAGRARSYFLSSTEQPYRQSTEAMTGEKQGEEDDSHGGVRRRLDGRRIGV